MMQKFAATVALVAGANAIEVEAQRSEPIYGLPHLGFGYQDAHHDDHHVDHYDAPHHDDHYGHEIAVGNDGYLQKERGVEYGEPTKAIYAKCYLKDPEEESTLGGTINFEQWPGKSTSMWGEIWGISPGDHGFHVHALGDLRGGCATTGPHYDPNNAHSHGAHTDDAHHRHAGDLEMAWADEYGNAHIDQKDMLLDLYGGHSIIGRSLVIHSKVDDLGKGGDAGSKASGNSGVRIGCCTVGLAAGPEPEYKPAPKQAYAPEPAYNNYKW